MGGVTDIIGSALIATGAFFYVVGAIGIYRMPDVFTRMHASSVSETLGVGLLILGMMFLGGFSFATLKLAIILGLIFFTSPMSTHALAQAALHEGLKPVGVGDEVLVGPGAHPGPEKIGRPSAGKKTSAAKKTARKTSGSSRKRKPAAKTAGRVRAGTSKGRAWS